MRSCTCASVFRPRPRSTRSHQESSVPSCEEKTTYAVDVEDLNKQNTPVCPGSVTMDGLSISLSFARVMGQGIAPLTRALVRPRQLRREAERRTKHNQGLWAQLVEKAVSTRPLVVGNMSRSLPLSFFLSAGHRGRLARPSGFEPALPPIVLLSGRLWGLTDC